MRKASVYVLVEVLLLLELEAEDKVKLVEADEEGDREREALHHAVGEVQSIPLELEREHDEREHGRPDCEPGQDILVVLDGI